MSLFKCKMCGGALEIDNGSSVGICGFCGTKQTLPKNEIEGNVNLYNRANNLRLKCEFDKASALYEKIVEADESDAEAHWGIVLCKYGVEYVEDPKTQKRIPTCHRTLFESVTKDLDYQMAVDYSDSDQQTIYENEARAIDKIQREILNIVKNEKPFDIFICYKEKDSNGNRTVDSVLANDIYYNLTNEGFNVFYAAITLEEKIGQEYEPYIFAALNSSKVMLVLGTKPEFLSAVWVKNEWSRFLNLMKTDRSKILIPCYRDMDPYDLPEEFSHLQAQDMGKIGFINDLIRGINKIIKKTPEKEYTLANNLSKEGPNRNSLLKRVELFLEDGEFKRADDFCEKVLNEDPENSQAYFYKLLLEYKCNTKDDLLKLITKMSRDIAIKKGCFTKDEIIKQGISLFNSKNYKKIVRFAKTDLDKSILRDIDNAIEIDWDNLDDSLLSEMKTDGIEFDDYVCPNCGEKVSYPRIICQKGTTLHCAFCENEFKVSDNLIFYPQSDVDSVLFTKTRVAPEIIYRSFENKKDNIYTPFIISGTIVAVFNDIYEVCDYFGVKPREDEDIVDFYSFVLENDYGKMWICDFATVDVKFIVDQIQLGMMENNEWSDSFINEFGGYNKKDYPKKGENASVLGLYIGFNKRFNIPVCYFGINKIYYDWCLEE